MLLEGCRSREEPRVRALANEALAIHPDFALDMNELQRHQPGFPRRPEEHQVRSASMWVQIGHAGIRQQVCAPASCGHG